MIKVAVQNSVRGTPCSYLNCNDSHHELHAQHHEMFMLHHSQQVESHKPYGSTSLLICVHAKIIKSVWCIH